VQARNAANRDGVKKDILQGAKLAAYEGQVMHGEVAHEKTEDGTAITHGYDAVAGTVVMAAAGVLTKGAEAIAAYKAAKAALTPPRNVPKPPDGPDDTGPYKPMNGINQYGGQSTESLVNDAVNKTVTAGESPVERAAVDVLPKTPVKTIDDILDFGEETGLPDA
jgi:hypothetical protein